MENLEVAHRFNRTQKMIVWQWKYSFLKRHPRFTARNEDNLSRSRALGMNRSHVGEILEILERNVIELVLLNKPHRIFTAEEWGLRTNTRGGHVVCEKEKENIHSVSPKEKGETVTVLACINAGGNYMPPTIIFKEKTTH
jgi:hypothetical protein